MSKANGSAPQEDDAQAIARVSEVLRHKMAAHPYQTLGAALGLGFFVGGGLWKPLGRALLGWGAKMAVAAAISQIPGSDS